MRFGIQRDRQRAHRGQQVYHLGQRHVGQLELGHRIRQPGGNIHLNGWRFLDLDGLCRVRRALGRRIRGRRRYVGLPGFRPCRRRCP